MLKFIVRIVNIFDGDIFVIVNEFLLVFGRFYIFRYFFIFVCFFII